jgi:hypothetical protein
MGDSQAFHMEPSEVATYVDDEPRYGMSDSASPSASLSVSEPIDVPAALGRAGIDYVTVHEHRLLTIYRTGIFNIVTEPDPVSSAHTVAIECWDGPIPSHVEGTSPQELLDDFTNVFENGSVQ